MPKNGIFPSKESELNLYFGSAVPYLLVPANTTRLLVSTANKNDLTSNFAKWTTNFPLSQNNDTATGTVVDNKNDARDALMNSLRKIYGDIPDSAVTNQDRNTLRIAAPVTSRVASPVPTSKPVAKVDTSNRLQHTIAFVDEATPTSKAKPAGVRGCQIWVKIGSPAKDAKELTYIATDTATPYVLEFDGENGGKPAYYWLRWENTTGKTGPWSDEVKATITE